MSRPLGGYIGYDGEPTTDAATGIWTLREAEFYQRKAQWPIVFAPDVLTGLQLWLDASDDQTLYDATTGGSLVAADGGVARWEDKSGNDRHFTQGTSGSRPLRKTSVQNGLDVMRFDGTDDYLVGGDYLDVTGGNTLAMFVVVKRNQQDIDGNIINKFARNEDNATGANTNLGFVWRWTGANAIRAVWGNGGASSATSLTVRDTTSTYAASAFTAIGLTFTDGTLTSSPAMRVNGSVAASANVGSFTAASTVGNVTFPWRIGSAIADSGGVATVSLPLDGDIAEIIIYNSALSDTDREAVENYLMAKWGIT